jgi:hypothetical protein
MGNDEPAARKLPVPAWLIAGFFLLTGGLVLLKTGSISLGGVNISTSTRTAFDRTSTADWAVAIAVSLAKIAGAVLLLLRRRQSYPVFLGVFLTSVAVALYDGIARGGFAAGGLSKILSVLFALGIMWAVCSYIKRLMKRGVLE